MKYCFIQKVAFKIPGSKRILWANILAQHQGLTLLIVPKPHAKQPHSIYFAVENVEQRLFEAVIDHRFDIQTAGVVEAAKKLKLLGESFLRDDFFNHVERDIGDED